MKALIDTYSDTEFANIVKQSDSYSDVCRKLGYSRNSGSVCKRIKQRIKNLQIDITHFTFGTASKRTLTYEEIFKEHSNVDQKSLVKYFKIYSKKPYKCSICDSPSFWHNKSMTLILDHINGINNDNRIENLRWVCPNCNSQLPTTGSRNIKNRERTKTRYFCENCGKEITNQATRCSKCEYEHRKQNSSIQQRISRKMLKNLIRTKTFTEIGQIYDVSDNAVKKWCEYYSLPKLKKDIKSYTEKEWKKL